MFGANFSGEEKVGSSVFQVQKILAKYAQELENINWMTWFSKTGCEHAQGHSKGDRQSVNPFREQRKWAAP
jgi:hypothetical protein